MGLILDTSALISLERDPELWNSDSIPPNKQIGIPAIVWAEALIGVRLAGSATLAARRLARIESIRRLTGIEPFTPEVAEHYADIFSELHKIGSLIPQNDIQVAATARAKNWGVLVGTQDEQHFQRIAHLNVQVLS